MSSFKGLNKSSKLTFSIRGGIGLLPARLIVIMVYLLFCT